MCKALIQQPGKPDRECKISATRDGYCAFHHPEEVELRFLEELTFLEKKKRRLEAVSVGRWMQEKHPEFYMQVRDEIRKHYPHRLQQESDD